MIFVADDAVWREYVAAQAALDRADVKNPFSHFTTSMARLREIDRLIRAKTALLHNLRAPRTVDRADLFAAADAVRNRESTKGPKPRIKDPLTER